MGCLKTSSFISSPAADPQHDFYEIKGTRTKVSSLLSYMSWALVPPGFKELCKWYFRKAGDLHTEAMWDEP